MICSGLRTCFLAGTLILAGFFAGMSPLEAAEATVIGYFDLTRIIALHPLMGKFDLQTRRFTETPSQPPKDLPLAIKRSELNIRAITLRLDQLKSRLETDIKSGGKAASDAVQAYWHRRKPIEAELAIERSRLTEYTEMQFMGRSTRNESIVPVLDQILSDVRDAIGEVAARNRAHVILDVSALNRRQASRPATADLSSVQGNPVQQLWQAPDSNVTAETLERWLDDAGEIMVRRFPGLGCPIPTGGVDLEPEIIRLLNRKAAIPRATTDRSHQ